MAILSTNQRLINVGDSYSAGNGIDITNNIISVTGDNAPYSAGDNIDIQDHIISGKDWSNDIEQASANAYNVTTAWVQDNYANSADMTYISAMVDTKLDTSAWSSVSGDLATESYVIMADNITYERAKGYVDSKGFATEEFVNENTSGKLDSTAFDNWQNGQYATDLQTIEGQISNKLDSSSFSEASGNFYTNDNPSGFITGVDLSNYYTKDETSGKEELANAFANIPVGDPEVNAYVTSNSASIDESTDLVQSNSSTWNDVTAYQSNSANYITAHQDISNLMPKSESANFYPMTGNPSGFINTLPEEEEVEFEEINLSSFATSSQINDLSAAIDYVSANAGGTTLTGDAQGAIDNVYNNSGKYVLNNANGVYIGNDNTATLNGFAQGGSNKAESYAFAQGLYNKATGYSIAQGQFCTASHESIAQGVSNSATEYSQAFGSHTKANNSGMAIGTYNNITSAAFVIGNGSASTARSDCFIIDHNGNVSACGKISANGVELGAGGGGGNPEVESYVQTNSAGIDDTVTSFQTNSSTYMVEPNLEYNAVNEISGYNGSAIAQYGAEKQWLVHDDTLVHVANSAQYALGCNVSALQRLMGIDETEILASTATGDSFTLTEPFSSFKQVKIKLKWWDKNPTCYYEPQHVSNSQLRMAWTYMDQAGDANPLELIGVTWSSNDGLTYTQTSSVAKVYNLTTAYGSYTVSPTALSIYGIGHKEV